MEKNTRKKKNLSFVDSVANNEEFKPMSLEDLEGDTSKDSEETSEPNTSSKAEDKAEDLGSKVEASDNSKEVIEQKGKKSLMEILDKKPEGPVKAIPIPITIHSKIASLSGITEFGISDIAASVLNNFLNEHKSEILKMLKRQTQNEWK